MSFDGVFIHHLLLEIKANLINQRINQINGLDQSSFAFLLSNQQQFIIDVQPDTAHMRFSKLDFIFNIKTSPLLNMLKKHLEGAIIKAIEQKDNDRIVIFHLENDNFLGEKNTNYLIAEFFGRNANLILVDQQYLVIECQKKIFTLGERENRIMIPKVVYTFPKNDKINPFLEKELANQNIYTGVSSLLFQEMISQNSLQIINGPTQPTLIEANNKYYFYCFDLPSIIGERTPFSSLSMLLEYFYVQLKKQSSMNIEQKVLENFIKKEKNKLSNKLAKQKQEQAEALENLIYEQYGNLLSSNLHLVKKGATKIEVQNYYNNYELLEIPLDPLLEPTKNLALLFSKYKKAKRAIIHIKEQIKLTEQDLLYYQCLEEQTLMAKKNEIQEIMQELGIGKAKKVINKKQKPQLTVFEDADGNKILVGKNNIQNNYLTHSLAKKTDYFFHVKDAPGSHTILQAKNPSDETLVLAAEIAAYFSTKRLSSQVAVDYTFKKNVKKVPKTKGSFVTYTQQKTIYVTPNIDIIKQKTNKKS